MNTKWRVQKPSLVVNLLLLGILHHTKGYRIGLLVKQANHEFFKLAQQGCDDYSAQNELNATCLYRGPVSTDAVINPDPNGTDQVQMLLDLIEIDKVDAIAVSVRNAAAITSAINRAVIEYGIPVVTFDSDAPNSKRISYVGTDNKFLGITLAKTAKQIAPAGGTFCGVVSDNAENILQRFQAFRKEMLAENKPHKNITIWREIDESPISYDRDLDSALRQLRQISEQNPTVFVSMTGEIMGSDGYALFYETSARPRNVSIVVGDDFPVQIDLLRRGYGQGLVGQLPYRMGFQAVAALHDILRGQELPATIGTNLISHVNIPVVLPDLTVDNNLIGNWVYLGNTLFVVVAVSVTGCITWALYYRGLSVVQAAQPVFLILLCVGVLIMGSALIPLGMDDGGDPDSLSAGKSSLICMSIPWFACCGLSITFSALFSKLLRVNKIIVAAEVFQRITVTPADVLPVAVILLTLNVIVLSLWTAIDPLHFVRDSNPGTDDWNRIISTYGSCRSQNAMRFLLPLGLINLCVLVLANYQAYICRKIKSEFAESRYIGVAMISLLQAFATGIPLVTVVRDSPVAYYIVTSFTTFVICMVVLLVIFLPKMKIAESFSRRSSISQRRIIENAIKESKTVNKPGSVRFGRSQMTTAAIAETTTSGPSPKADETNMADMKRSVRFETGADLDVNFSSSQEEEDLRSATESMTECLGTRGVM